MTAGKLIMRAGQRGLWHPKHLSPSVLSAWWCADDHGTARMTDDGAGLISNWVDRAGGLAVTADTSARPTWTSNAFNSAYAGLTFDGVANCFVTTSLATLPTGSTPGEIWVVGNASGAATNTTACGYGNNTAGQNRQIGTGGAGNLARVSDKTTSSSGPASWSSPQIVKGDWSGTTMNGYETGVPFVGNPTTIGSLNTGTTRLRIGANANTSASTFWSGVIRHAMILTGVLSDAKRQKLEGWLAWDAGLQASLPATHPYRLFRP